MVIKITKIYPDKELRRNTVRDEIITVSEERGNFLIEQGYASPIYSDNLEYHKQIEELTNMVKDKENSIIEKDKQIEELTNMVKELEIKCKTLLINSMTDDEHEKYAKENKIDISKSKSREQTIAMLLK